MLEDELDDLEFTEQVKDLENFIKNTCNCNLVRRQLSGQQNSEAQVSKNLADFVETSDAMISFGRFKGMFASSSRSWRS